MGRCPSLFIEVDSAGHVEYEGFSFVARRGRHSSDDGKMLFGALTRVAAFTRPDSVAYQCDALDASVMDVVVETTSGRTMRQSATLPCFDYVLFFHEVMRLLPTLALTPTERPYRFATDWNPGALNPTLAQ